MSIQIDAEDVPLLAPSHAEKIQGMRLDKELQFLRSLNRPHRLISRRHVVVEGILHDQLDLHIHIPQQYPFREPLFATSDAPQLLWPVSEAVEQWVPKFKILQVVELLALRINERHAIGQTVDKYTLLKGFYQTRALPLILILAVVLRIMVGLGSYSGMSDYPSLGDFQAHRNWMAITVNRPISAWYQENDLQPWWRIDYPPVAAYLSYIFGTIYRRIEPGAMDMQRGYESESLKVYMRFTVLLVDMVFLIPALLLIGKQFNRHISNLLLVTLLIKPDVLLIDHGHFQYNSLILGLTLLAFHCLLNKKYYLVCLLYTVAVHAKQMATYYSLGFLAALLGLAIREHRHNRTKLMVELGKYGLIVVGVSLAIWAPWINHYQTLSSVLTAIFPVHRGLYQLKVPNFWCISDILFKWQSLFAKQTLLFFCLAGSVVGSLPSMLSMIINPTRKAIVIGFSTISMTFFMFSYHVHEKSILLPLLMMPLAAELVGGWVAHDVIVGGCVGMFHLLKEDGQQLGYFALMALFLMFSNSYVSLREELPREREEEKTLAIHKQIYSSKWLRMLVFGVMITLHVNEKIVSPPASLPYLHHLLFAAFSFAFNSYWLLLGNFLQIEWVMQWVRDRSRKAL